MGISRYLDPEIPIPDMRDEARQRCMRGIAEADTASDAAGWVAILERLTALQPVYTRDPFSR